MSSRRTFLSLATRSAIGAALGSLEVGCRSIQSVPTNPPTSFRPGTAAFDESTAFFNSQISRIPSAVIRPMSVQEVSDELRNAGRRGLGVCVRGRGHGGALSAIRDGALLVDMSALRGVQIDVRSRTARVQAGASLDELQTAAFASGLAIVSGSCPQVGVAGYLLNGGVSLLNRSLGLASDNILGATMIEPGGGVCQVSESREKRVWRAMRGGGAGIMGVFTQFEIRLHWIQSVYGGLLTYSGIEADSALSRFISGFRHGPDSLGGSAQFRQDPELGPVLRLLLVAIGKSGAEAVDQIVQPGRQTLGKARWQSYQEFIHEYETRVPTRPRFRWNSAFVQTTDEDALAAATLRAYRTAASVPARMLIEPLGGQVRAIRDDCAFDHRDQDFLVSWVGLIPDDAGLASATLWMESVRAELSPFDSGTAYQGYIDPVSGPGWRYVDPRFFPRSAPELRRVAEALDADGIFRHGFPESQVVAAHRDVSSMPSTAPFRLPLAGSQLGGAHPPS